MRHKRQILFSDIHPKPKEPGVVWLQGVGCVHFGLKDLAAMENPLLTGFEIVERTEPNETRLQWWVTDVVTRPREMGVRS